MLQKLRHVRFGRTSPERSSSIRCLATRMIDMFFYKNDRQFDYTNDRQFDCISPRKEMAKVSTGGVAAGSSSKWAIASFIGACFGVFYYTFKKETWLNHFNFWRCFDSIVITANLLVSGSCCWKGRVPNSSIEPSRFREALWHRLWTKLLCSLNHVDHSKPGPVGGFRLLRVTMIRIASSTVFFVQKRSRLS